MSPPFAASSGPLPTIPPLLAYGIRPLPLLPLQLVLAGFLDRIWRRNPAIFDRLGVHAGAVRDRPTDLPLPLSSRPLRRIPACRWCATCRKILTRRISSSLVNLLALLEVVWTETP
jgi:hypothetical protein